MRPIALMAALTALAACSGGDERATFTCPNGPSVGVVYSGETVTIAFDTGRTEVLPRSGSKEGFYAKPGVIWQVTGFRSARLTDGQSSYACDQSSI